MAPKRSCADRDRGGRTARATTPMRLRLRLRPGGQRRPHPPDRTGAPPTTTCPPTRTTRTEVTIEPPPPERARDPPAHRSLVVRHCRGFRRARHHRRDRRRHRRPRNPTPLPRSTSRTAFTPPRTPACGTCPVRTPSATKPDCSLCSQPRTCSPGPKHAASTTSSPSRLSPRSCAKRPRRRRHRRAHRPPDRRLLPAIPAPDDRHRHRLRGVRVALPG